MLIPCFRLVWVLLDPPQIPVSPLISRGQRLLAEKMQSSMLVEAREPCVAPLLSSEIREPQYGCCAADYYLPTDIPRSRTSLYKISRKRERLLSRISPQKGYPTESNLKPKIFSSPNGARANMSLLCNEVCCRNDFGLIVRN